MFDPPSSTKAVVLAGPAASDKGAAKAQQKVELQDPYRQFIQDASKLYVDALKHNTTQIAKLIAVCASRRNTPAYVGLGSEAAITRLPRNVRFRGQSGQRSLLFTLRALQPSIGQTQEAPH